MKCIPIEEKRNRISHSRIFQERIASEQGEVTIDYKRYLPGVLGTDLIHDLLFSAGPLREIRQEGDDVVFSVSCLQKKPMPGQLYFEPELEETGAELFFRLRFYSGGIARLMISPMPRPFNDRSIMLEWYPELHIQLAILLLFGLAFGLNLFPTGGSSQIGALHMSTLDRWVDFIRHSILPALSIVLASIGGWALSMRGLTVSVMGEDFLSLARAKGLPERVIFLRYALRNAILPQITVLAIALGPKVIIADEPTSALDVVVQRIVCETLKDVQKQLNAAVILIRHDWKENLVLPQDLIAHG